MVCSSTGRVDQPAGDARDEQGIVNLELDHGVELLLAVLQHTIQLLGLGDGTGETI